MIFANPQCNPTIAYVESITTWLVAFMLRDCLNGQRTRIIQESQIPLSVALAMNSLARASQYIRGSVGTASWMCACYVGEASDRALEHWDQNGNEGHELGSIIVFWSPRAGGLWRVCVGTILTRRSPEQSLARSVGRICGQAVGTDMGYCLLEFRLAAAELLRDQRGTKHCKSSGSLGHGWTPPTPCARMSGCRVMLPRLADHLHNIAEAKSLLEVEEET